MTRDARDSTKSNGDTPASSSPPARTPGTGDRHRTILVVENDPSVRDVVGILLDSLGYLVIAAAHGKDALVISRGQPGRIDVLLTDVVIPEMTGLQLAEQLRRERPGIAVVLMSGSPTADTHVQHAQRKGHFLRKPFDSGDLDRVMRAAIDDAAASTDT